MKKPFTHTDPRAQELMDLLIDKATTGEMFEPEPGVFIKVERCGFAENGEPKFKLTRVSKQ